MPTSGSTDFTLNRNDAIRMAFEEIGVAIEGENLEAEDTAVANRVLNLMLKAWMAHGLHLWQRDTQSIPLGTGQFKYTLGMTGADVTMIRPQRILEMNRKTTSDGNEVKMTAISRNEYEFLPNKTTQGTPVQYNYNPTLGSGELYLWPAPDSSASSNLTIEIVYETVVEDMDQGVDNFDFPVEWLEAVTLGLAYRLSGRYSLPIQERRQIRSDMREALALVKGYDTEQESIFISPESRYTRS